MTMRNAVAHSNNVVAVLAADKVGMSNVLDLAEKMGISTLDKHGDDNLAVALGGLTKGCDTYGYGGSLRGACQ